MALVDAEPQWIARLRILPLVRRLFAVAAVPHSSAAARDDERMTNHRYVLERNWIGTGGLLNWICLNPSTADDKFDDQSVRKMVGFSKLWGYSQIVVTNLFAFRATLPEDLHRMYARAPLLAIGNENDNVIERWASKADAIVCAWGNLDALGSVRANSVEGHLLKYYDLKCIRKNKSGCPAHPVREPYTDAPLTYRDRIAA